MAPVGRAAANLGPADAVRSGSHSGSVAEAPGGESGKFAPMKLRWIGLLLAVLVATPVAARRNVLLICVDDLRPELGAYGAEHADSPHIDALAERGRRFERHYVQAPTCGASRYALLMGRYNREVRGHEVLFERAAGLEDPPEEPSLPRHFRDHGYETVSVGKVSHHPGGRGGPRWDDDDQPEMPGAWTRHLQPAGPWMDPRGVMHALAHGETRKRDPRMDVFQAAEGGDDIYPDGLIARTASAELRRLAAGEAPFFLAVGFIRPHLPFGPPREYLDRYEGVELPPIPHPHRPAGRTTWHESAEFMKYHRWGRDPREDPAFAEEVRRHYLACVSYADAQVGRLLGALEAAGAADDTVVVLWGDHGWHLGEHAVWGKHTLFEESLRSPLIVAYPDLPEAGRASDAVVETVDLYPTLCGLTGLPEPAGLDGRSLAPALEDPTVGGGAAVSYSGAARTLRTPRHRLIVHGDGHAELYDHAGPEGETSNLADAHPDLVATLKAELEERLRR